MQRAPRRVFNRTSTRNPRSLRRQENHRLTGRQMNVDPDPPIISLRPWYSLTLQSIVMVDSKTQSYQVLAKEVFDGIQKQLGITGDLEARMQFVKAWSLSSMATTNAAVVQPSLSVTFYDLIRSVDLTTAATLKTIYDNGTATLPAAVGFMWPVSHQQVNLAPGAPVINVSVTGTGGQGAASAKAQLYFHLLWRVRDPDPVAPNVVPVLRSGIPTELRRIDLEDLDLSDEDSITVVRRCGCASGR